jgi:hypothetical protein
MSRLMIFAVLALAVATALWLSHPPSRFTWLRWLLAALVVINVGIEAYPTFGIPLSPVPAFISTGQYRSQLRPGEIVVVVSKVRNSGLLWQAESGYQIRIAGGFFNDAFVGQVADRLSDLPPAVAGLVDRDAASAKAFKAYIERAKIGAVLVDARYKPEWARLLPRLGLIGHQVGGVIVYPTDGCRACHVPQTRS